MGSISLGRIWYQKATVGNVVRCPFLAATSLPETFMATGPWTSETPEQIGVWVKLQPRRFVFFQGFPIWRQRNVTAAGPGSNGHEPKWIKMVHHTVCLLEDNASNDGHCRSWRSEVPSGFGLLNMSLTRLQNERWAVASLSFQMFPMENLPRWMIVHPASFLYCHLERSPKDQRPDTRKWKK